MAIPGTWTVLHGPGLSLENGLNSHSTAAEVAPAAVQYPIKSPRKQPPGAQRRQRCYNHLYRQQSHQETNNGPGTWRVLGPLWCRPDGITVHLAQRAEWSLTGDKHLLYLTALSVMVTIVGVTTAPGQLR